MRRKDWLVGAAGATGLVAAQRADAAMIGSRRALLANSVNLTAAQIASGATYIWPMNDSGATALDIVGGANGTYTGGYAHGRAPLAPGLGSSTHFDGTSAYMTTGIKNPNGTGTTTPWTVELIVWADNYIADSTAGGNPRFLSNRSDVFNNKLEIYRNTGAATIYVQLGATNISFTPQPGPLILASVFDGANNLLYVNGILRASSTGASYVASTAYLSVGWLPALSQAYYLGLSQSLAIYPTALSATALLSHAKAAKLA